MIEFDEIHEIFSTHGIKGAGIVAQEILEEKDFEAIKSLAMNLSSSQREISDASAKALSIVAESNHQLLQGQSNELTAALSQKASGEFLVPVIRTWGFIMTNKGQKPDYQEQIDQIYLLAEEGSWAVMNAAVDCLTNLATNNIEFSKRLGPFLLNLMERKFTNRQQDLLTIKILSAAVQLLPTFLNQPDWRKLAHSLSQSSTERIAKLALKISDYTT